jgi:SAM-dependent methyltransferase
MQPARIEMTETVPTPAGRKGPRLEKSGRDTARPPVLVPGATISTGGDDIAAGASIANDTPKLNGKANGHLNGHHVDAAPAEKPSDEPTETKAEADPKIDITRLDDASVTLDPINQMELELGDAPMIIPVPAPLVAPAEVRLIHNAMPTHAWYDDGHNYDDTASAFDVAAVGEKRLIVRSLRREFTTAVEDGAFDRENDRMIDIGAGTFLMGLPFLRSGVKIDALETSPGMLQVAARTLGLLPNSGSIQVKNDTISSYEDIERLGGYKFGMMNFVHQCAPDRESLGELFKMAGALIKPGGRLVIVGTNPHNLHLRHTYCEYDVKPDMTTGEIAHDRITREPLTDNDGNPVKRIETCEPLLKEGDRYNGVIKSELGDKRYPVTDHFWKIKSLIAAAKDHGFVIPEGRAPMDIDDDEGFDFPVDPLTSPYILIPLEKTFG